MLPALSSRPIHRPVPQERSSVVMLRENGIVWTAILRNSTGTFERHQVEHRGRVRSFHSRDDALVWVNLLRRQPRA